MEVVSRFFKNPNDSFFLFGPRGTGKSLWLRQSYPQALNLDLLEPETYRTISARPERLSALLEGRPQCRKVIIDEVQKVPQILDLVHYWMEKRRSLQFVLSGSSARKLKRQETNLLSGRALLKNLHPFMAAELGSHFSLGQALRCGLLPLVWGAKNPEETLASYIALYLREEVLQEGLVRNLGSFSRFLEAASFAHASILNISAVARECQVERKTVEGYLSILEDLLLAYRIPVFAKRQKRRLIAHSKFYFFDCGVFQTLRPKGPLDHPEEIAGPALEGLVLQHLRAYAAYRGNGSSIHYWRTPHGQEVDLVVYGEEDFAAIEVKNSARVRSEDLQALRAFKEDYPQCDLLLLYRGKERLKEKGVLCLPCESFLAALQPGQNLRAALKDI